MKHRYQIPQDANLQEFVSFWARAYDYPSDDLYKENIGEPLTNERIHKLFEWKNGGELSRLKQKSVDDHYVSSISKLEKISKNTPPDQWLRDFGTGGAIWNIFFLHIWNQKYPIFDQHVFRSMKFIQTGKVSETPSGNAPKIRIYLEEYIAFYRKLDEEMKPSQPGKRALDRALWKFGQFLKMAKNAYCLA